MDDTELKPAAEIRAGSPDRIASPERLASLRELEEAVRGAGLTTDVHQRVYVEGPRGHGLWNDVAIFLAGFGVNKALDEIYDLAKAWARSTYAKNRDRAVGERVLVVATTKTHTERRTFLISEQGEEEDVARFEGDE